MSSVIPKPIMRRLHIRQVKRQLVEMAILVVIGALGFKTYYIDPRKKAYEEFYKTYDCEAALKRMNDAGLMQSCPKD